MTQDNKDKIIEEYYSDFKGEKWRDEINVSDFIDNNYTEYVGDDSFLQGKSNFKNKFCFIIL